MDNFLIFDIFTVNSFFDYESRKRVPSYPGLLFSIIIDIFLLSNFISSDMVQKTNPKTSDIFIADEGNYEVSSKNFFPRISLSDENGIHYQYFDPKIWNFQVFLYSAKSNQIIHYINFENCSQSLCLSNLSNFSLNQDVFMEIFITMCVNSTNSDVICKPTEEIYNFIETIGFALDFKEVSFFVLQEWKKY